MRLFFLVVYIFYSPLLSGQEKATIEVTGRLKGDYTGKIFLCFEDMILQKDSAEITAGKFHFTCDVSLPVLGRLHLDQTSLLFDFYIDERQVYLDCTNKMNVTNAGKDTFNVLTIDSVTGSKLEMARQNIFRTLNISKAGKVYEKDTLAYFNKLNAFVEQNRKSKLAPYLIALSSRLSYSQLYSLYKKLDSSLNGTYEMKGVVRLIKWKERQSLGLLNEGMPFHDVSLTDINGKQINTKDFKGNYFLIICWASWCKPCMKENPVLRNVYNKYKDNGLTMIGVSYDKSQFIWKDAIKQNNLSWVQLIDVNGFDGDLTKYYGIQSIGKYFLLDKNRKIINADSLEEILKRLDVLMAFSKKD